MLTSVLAGLAVRGRRVPRGASLILNSKRGPRDYYKGKGVKSTGTHTVKGGFKILKERLPNFVVPDLANTKLKPYVTPRQKE